MAFTFDGPNKLVICTAGTVSIDLADLWSRWKDWMLAGNAGYAIAFDTVGGEPIDPVAGTLVPLYLFLRNGWKIRPQEANHTLYVTGGSLVVDGGGDPFTNTTGNYVVRVVYQQPVQAIGYSTTGSLAPTAEQNATAVWTRILEGTLTAEQLQRVLLAALAGKRDGIGTTTETYYGQDGTTPRITLTPDVNGNGTPTVNGS